MAVVTETIAHPASEHPYLRDIVTMKWDRGALEEFVALFNSNDVRNRDGLRVTLEMDNRPYGEVALISTTHWRA